MPPERLILVRHAPAMGRDARRWPDDAARPLRPQGAREFRAAARGLSRLLGKRGVIASSPFARALETAHLLQRAWPDARLERPWKELRPDADLSTLLRRVASSKGRGDLVLVGHEPEFSRLVGLAVSGEPIPVVRVSRGGAIALEFSASVRPGGGRILWALTRGQLGRHAKARGGQDDG